MPSVTTDTTPPSTPTGLTETSSTTTQVVVTWVASTDNVGVTGYEVYLGGTRLTTVTALTYTFTGLTCGTSKQVSVDAIDAAGNRSAQASLTVSTAACADTTPPSTPSGLSAGSISGTSVTLSWRASTDNVGVTGYDVYLGATRVSSTVTSVSYTFAGLSCGTSYTLGVDAHDAAGNVSGRATTNATTSACTDATPPSTPTGLVETSSTATQVVVTWAASTDSVGVTGYEVYLGGTRLTTVAALTYTFTGLTCGTSQQVSVDAIDAAGHRSAQASLTVSTAPCADTTAPTTPSGLSKGSTTATSVTLSWTASTDNVGVTGYDVYLGATRVSSTVTSVSYTFAGLSCGTSYTLGVDAHDAAGNVSGRATTNATTSGCTDTTPPSAPSALSVSSVTQTGLTLGWTASTDNVGVAGYLISESGTQVVQTTATSYALTGLSCGTAYSLSVVAFDAAGNLSVAGTMTGSTSACPTAGASLATPSVFFAQNAAGSGNGGSCADAYAISVFNNSSSWGSGALIKPGTVVGLCGTITSTVAAQGSGTASQPITIQFQSGANLAQPVCPWNGCLNLTNVSYVTVDGGSNGVIQATANGSSLANQVAETMGVYLGSCNNCTLEDITIANIYARTSSTDSTASSGQTDGVEVYDGNNDTLTNLTIHDTDWAIYQRYDTSGQGENVTISNSNFYNVDHGIALTFNFGGGATGPFFDFGNHFHDFAAWDSPGDTYHHDGLHCYTSGTSGVPAHINGLYWYDNLTDGNYGNNMTSPVFLEGGTGSGSTPCADATSNVYLFNNVSIANVGLGNGLMGLFSGAIHADANTLMGQGSGVGISVGSSQNVTLENNVISGFDQLIVEQGATFSLLDHNLYAAGGGNAFVCNGSYLNFGQFSTWQSCIDADAHSASAASANLSATGAPQAGSAAIGFGANLTSLCSGYLTPICDDYSGATRPSTGNWTAGAQQ